jgi:hypothetical protein
VEKTTLHSDFCERGFPFRQVYDEVSFPPADLHFTVVYSTWVYVPGKIPVLPLILPVHQSSALSVCSMISILSPALNPRSPSA